ncbi:MAG: hypothetical protein CSB47_08405 [Proteobacteria bacterium]|nr:MAG: hypothetical protein CSB47_08405 [Pseudomonadota bacterium]
MKSIRLRNIVAALVMGMAGASVWAQDSGSDVIIEIVADDLSAEKVETNIAEPIEVLMGGLDDVLLVSAKYSDNKAEITVTFDSKFTQRGELVEHVRKALDKMSTMPDSIISLSVSLASEAEESLPASTEGLIRPAKTRSFQGHYLGNIQSSNELIPVLTSFFKANDRWGMLSTGQYQMMELKSVVKGELSACLPKEGYVLDCRWKDKYGQGDVSFQFTDDYERFKAMWRIDRVQGEFKWDGAKVKAPAN